MIRVCQRCQHQNTPEAKFCLQCGAMLEVEVENAGDPLVGKILLGRYRVSRVLGEGGMGKVYLAEQKMGTAVRKVAIKTLHPELGSDPQIVARFHRECETVIELHHPNTVQFYDFGELEDKSLFIVMEFIEGEDLAHTLRRGTIDPARVDKILIQISGSLHEAHERGIVHRDLKPENIYLTQRGGQQDFVKVLDFGIAKRNEAEDESKGKLTKQGMVLGTPPYMSPEQFSGQALDARSDIYSLGVMTYEMITGQLPFEARTPWEWATKHLTQAPTPIESYPAGATLAPHKRAAIARALAKNRDERQANVLDFMQEFTGLADPQSAWTLATSAGLRAGAAPAAYALASGGGYTPPYGGATPHGGAAPSQAGFAATHPSPAYGQPQQAPGYGPHSPPYGHPQSGAYPQQSHPSQPHSAYPTPAPQASPPYGQPQQSAFGTDSSMNATGSIPGLAPRKSGSGKWIALGLVVLLLGGGAIAAGVWAAQKTESVVAAVENPATVEPQPIGQEPKPSTDGPAAPTTTGTAPTSTGTPRTTGTTTPPQGDDARPTTPDPTPDTTQTPTPDRDDNDSRHGRDHTDHASGQPTNAEVDRAKADVQAAEAALSRNDVEAAARSLSSAQRAVGRAHPLVAGLRSELTRRGSNAVGILMMQGRCPDAQATYRQLRAVGAEGASRQHFSPDWCPRP